MKQQQAAAAIELDDISKGMAIADTEEVVATDVLLSDMVYGQLLDKRTLWFTSEQLATAIEIQAPALADAIQKTGRYTLMIGAAFISDVTEHYGRVGYGTAPFDGPQSGFPRMIQPNTVRLAIFNDLVSEGLLLTTQVSPQSQPFSTQNFGPHCVPTGFDLLLQRLGIDTKQEKGFGFS